MEQSGTLSGTFLIFGTVKVFHLDESYAKALKKTRHYPSLITYWNTYYVPGVIKLIHPCS